MISLSHLRETKELIKNAQVIHVYTHAYPDGDAISSVAALNFVLTRMDKTVVNRIATPIAPMFQWLGLETTDRKTLPLPDMVIGVDFGDRQQLGSLSNVFSGEIEVVPAINIDHHYHANEEYGSINIVLDTSSTTHILYHLFNEWPIPINKRLATFLLYGLIADTHYFQKANTDLATLRVATDLVKLGANPHLVSQKLHKSKDLLSMKFWGEVLSSIELYGNGQLAVGTISNDVFERYRMEESALNLDGLVNFLTAIESTKITLLIKQRKNEVRVSFRSDFQSADNDVELEIINVSKIASQFGGGGHVGAAGCSLKMPPKVAEELLIQACLTALDDPKYLEKIGIN